MANQERVIARLRPHGRALLVPSLLLIVVAAAAGWASRFVEQAWQGWALLAAAVVLAVVCFVVPAVRWAGTSYVVTTRRIVLRSGLATRSRQELLHSRGYDVTVRKNAVQAVLRSGDIRINVGLEHPIVLRDVPNAVLVQDALHDLMEESLNPIAANRQREQATGTADDTVVWGER